MTDHQPESGDGYVAPTIDVAELTSILDGAHAAIRDRVRMALPSYADVLVAADEMPRTEFRERVKEAVLELADDGMTRIGFPTEYGDDDIGGAVAAFETLAYGDLSVLIKLGVQSGLFGGAIHQLGTEPHHERYLTDVISGRLLGCFAMTETGHGSNVQAIGTRAVYDDEAGEFVVTTPDRASWKDYIGNAAAHGEMAAVFAQLEVGGEEHGVHALLVPIRVDGKPAPGVHIEDDGPKMGLNGVDNGRLAFDGVRVPRTALLDQFAQVTETGDYVSEIENPNRRFFTMLGTLVQGRVSVGGAGLSASKVALTIAIRYALRRRQFSSTGDDVEELLLDYGQHQRRLLPMLARTYALHFAQEILVERLDEVFSGRVTDEKSRRLLESRAAGTKALATWHTTRTIQECREACGGAGYLAENRFTALKADTDVFTTFEGDNTVLLQLVAKGLITDYSSDFSDLDRTGMVMAVAGMAVETVLERSRAHQLLERVKDLLPGADEWDSEAGLLDSRYHLAMLQFREEHMLGSVARRLKRGVDEGTNPGEVFSQVQDHVIATARAHVERLVAEAFVEKVRSLPDGDSKVALELLADLHALTVIEADRAWFMEHGRLSAPRSKEITSEINDLCRKIRPHARDFVDAFAVPRQMLRAADLIGESAPASRTTSGAD